MIYYKIESKVLTEALKDKSTFGVLSMYVGEFQNEEGYFITATHPECSHYLKAALMDYFFNEGGSKEIDLLWQLAIRLLGKQVVDMRIIKAINF